MKCRKVQKKAQARPAQSGQSVVYPNSCLEFEKYAVLLPNLAEDKIICQTEKN